MSTPLIPSLSKSLTGSSDSLIRYDWGVVLVPQDREIGKISVPMCEV